MIHYAAQQCDTRRDNTRPEYTGSRHVLLHHITLQQRITSFDYVVTKSGRLLCRNSSTMALISLASEEEVASEEVAKLPSEQNRF